MRYEFGRVDGLCTLFASKADMENSVFKPEVAQSLDINSTIYVQCIDGDAAIFGREFIEGSSWIITHGVIVGDGGSRSSLYQYNKGSDTSPILPTDSIQDAIAKLDNRSEASASDWIIIP
jgi:hypothetical protein